MLKKIYNTVIHSIGLSCLVWMIGNGIFPDAVKIYLLYIMVILSILSGALGTLLFQKQMTYRQLWLRRAILIGIDALTLTTLLIAFHAISNISAFKIAMLYIGIILVYFVCAFAVYFVADLNEKRVLKKINNHFKQNTKE